MDRLRSAQQTGQFDEFVLVSAVADDPAERREGIQRGFHGASWIEYDIDLCGFHDN